MVFIRTRLDYGITIMFLVVFTFTFFFMSSFGDLHYSSSSAGSNDPAFLGDVNMQVYLGPLILIYEAFQLYVLPGKKRIREIDKRLVIFKFRTAIRKKLQEGIDEYHEWRLRRLHK